MSEVRVERSTILIENPDVKDPLSEVRVERSTILIETLM